MTSAIWALVIGTLLILVALSGRLLKRLPISTAMLYLAAGYGLSPAGMGLMSPDLLTNAPLLEAMTELAVLISLFAAGLKLGLKFSDPRWYLPLRLAVVSMMFTVTLIALCAMLGLGFSLGAAILLGGILAPTDPVLASDVQVENADDRDRLRFSLTGEGGLNDGAAFPFVMLGLGLLGLHDLGPWGWRWLAVDVIWAIVGGLMIGAVLGELIGRLVVYMRSQHKESVGLDEFVALGLIALTYGLAVLSHTYGFLAVFAAGIALQRIGQQPALLRRESAASAVQPVIEVTVATVASAVSVVPGLQAKQVIEELATHESHASAYMMHEVQGFNERLERLAELAIVMMIGAALYFTTFPSAALWFIPLLFLLVRPLSVWFGLRGAPVSRDQRWLISWFGIRGISSIYYLTYAINHGVSPDLAKQLVALTLTTVAVSIVLHGLSVTPLMSLYTRRKGRQKRE